MTTADEIMAEALRKADIGYNPTRIPAQPVVTLVKGPGVLVRPL